MSESQEKESVHKFLWRIIQRATSMNIREDEKLKQSVHAFLNSIIHRATVKNVRKLSKHKLGLFSVIERILDLFTSSRQYKWQLDETHNVIPYFESHRRIILILVTVSSILLITCVTLTLIVEIAYINDSEYILPKPYTFQETGKYINQDQFYIMNHGLRISIQIFQKYYLYLLDCIWSIQMEQL